MWRRRRFERPNEAQLSTATKVLRERAIRAEQEQWARISLIDMPADDLEHVSAKRCRLHLVVLSAAQHGWPILVPALDGPIDDQRGGYVPNTIPRDRVHLSGAQSKTCREIEERIPLRLRLEQARQKPIAVDLGIPSRLFSDHLFGRDVRDRLQQVALQCVSQHRPDECKVMIDGARRVVCRQRLLGPIHLERRDRANK